MWNKKQSNSHHIDTLVGVGSIFDGNIESRGTVRIDGTITGDVRAGGDVYVGNNATVTGNISGSNVYLSGTLKGNVQSLGILKLHSSAKLYGDIQVQSFVSDEGGLFLGKCSMLEATESVPSTPETNKKRNRTSREYKKSTVVSQLYEDIDKNENAVND